MIIINGTILLDGDKPAAAEIVIDGDTISNIRLTGGPPGDILALPGIIDFHGDAFEREIMPRPGVVFPLDLALHEVDRRLAANGITTAYHAVTASWESGLRSIEQLERMIATLAETRGTLAVDHRIQVRFESHGFDLVERVCALIKAGAVDVVAFNNHLPGIRRDLDNPVKAGEYAARAGVPVADYRAQVDALAARSDEVAGAQEAVARSAQAHAIRLAVHDSRSQADHRYYAGLGCTLCEFPITVEAAACARIDGHDVIMGAPNIVRGGSHKGDGLSALEYALSGGCTILASDYYYPAPLRAAFTLAASAGMTLGTAWRLVSEHPARALALDDRGRLAAGLRADMILVDRQQNAAPRVLATIAGGRVVHATHGASPLLSSGRRIPQRMVS